jgi:putative ABC transport system permease protein
VSPSPRSWLRGFRLPWRTPAKDVDAELRFHFDERVEELVKKGVPPKEALDRARVEFGDPAAVRAELIGIDERLAGRETRQSTLEAIALPFRFALRRLARQPAFFALTTGSLTLALGATTAAIGFADAWKNPKLSYAEPERLATISMIGGPVRNLGGFTTAERWSYIENNPAFESAAFTSYWRGDVRIAGTSSPQGLGIVSSNLFAVTGIKLIHGSGFAPGDESGVIVSDAIWARFFENRDSLEGAAVTVDGRSYDIVGVMPGGSGWPITSQIMRRMTAAEEAAKGWPVVRLKPGATIAQVQAQLEASQKLINARNPDASRPYWFVIKPVINENAKALSAFHIMMLLVAAFVLTIASANISSLFLARAAHRRRDLALRLSLGASRSAIILDVLAELVIIAGVGFAIGLFMASSTTSLVRALIPVELSWQALVDLQWSWRVFALSGGALLFVLFGAGFLPALQVSRIPPMEPIKDSSGGSTGKRPQRMKSVVMFQLAVSLVMLIVTSLMTSGVATLMTRDFGHNPKMVTVVSGNFIYKWNTAVLGNQTATEFLLPRMEAVPGVALASFYGSNSPDGLQILSDDIARDARPLMAMRYTIAGPRFLETIGVPMLEGRDFIAGDELGDGAVILDERAAKELFPTTSAVGRRVKLGRKESNEPWRPVIGVAPNIVTRFPNGPDRDPSVYVATKITASADYSVGMRTFTLVVRAASADSAPVLPSRIRRALTGVIPNSVALSSRLLSANTDDNIAGMKRAASLFGMLSVGALIFAVAGLFAVLSYMVSNRMREFGIRVAIGADKADVARLVLRDGLELALGGTAIGGSAGIAITFAMWAPMFGVNRMNVAALIVAEVVLIAVVLLASLAPALRAMRTDPVQVLRAS